MSDENTVRKLREASLLASKFFKELAEVFDDRAHAGDNQRLKKLGDLAGELQQNGKSASRGPSSPAKASMGAAPADKSQKPEDKKSSKKKAGKKLADSTLEAKGGHVLKKPLSAYMLYNNHRRPVLRSEYPQHSLPDISKIIGEEWQKLTRTQKDPWTEKAKDLRCQYEITQFHMKSQTNGQQNQNANLFKYPAKAANNFKVGEKRSHQDMNGSVGGMPGQAQRAGDGPPKIAKSSDHGGMPPHDGRKLVPQKSMKQIEDSSSLTSLSDDGLNHMDMLPAHTMGKVSQGHARNVGGSSQLGKSSSQNHQGNNDGDESSDL